MQLTRALVVAAIALPASRAHADTTFLSKLQVYTDSDHTQVVSPVVQAAADVTPDTSVSLGYLADVVSSASVDIVSQASATTIHDTRHQVSTSVSHTFDTLTPRLGYSFSRENDYLSHTLNLSFEKTLFDKTTTLSLGYGLSLNTISRANDLNFSRSLTVNNLSASWTQIVTARLITQLTYELGIATGFQASAYRFVPVRMAPDAAPEFWVAETDPNDRVRHALVFAANHAVGEDGSIQGDYRFYLDTWGITSHTIGARYFVNLTKNVELRLRERFYTQGQASFYQNNYTMAAKYITFDRELSPLWSETFGVKLSYRFAARLEAELKADLFYYSYADFTPLTSRTGANLGLGIAVTY